MRGDGKTACAQLTPSVQRNLAEAAAKVHIGGSCRDVAGSVHAGTAALTEHAPRSAQAAEMRRLIESPRVKLLSVTADRAMVRIIPTGPVADGPIRLARTGGRWRISGLSMYLVGSTAKTD